LAGAVVGVAVASFLIDEQLTVLFIEGARRQPVEQIEDHLARAPWSVAMHSVHIFRGTKDCHDLMAGYIFATFGGWWFLSKKCALRR